MILAGTDPFGWDPFAEMRRMHNEINRLFSTYEGEGRGVRGFPPINLWVGDQSAVVTAEIPGVDEDALDLDVHDNTLTIKGTRKAHEAADKAAWHRRERGYYGTFARTVELPFRIDPGKVEAHYANGVLEVELPRHEQDQPRRITIKSA